jgi:predicted transcriptional regulator
MTVLDRLVRKGALARRKVGRSFVYAPQATREAMRQTAVRELLDGFFDGSEEQLLVFLRPAAGASPANPQPVASRIEAAETIDTVLL